MSYNLLSGSVNFAGAKKGTVEDLVDQHTVQSITGTKTFTKAIVTTLTGSNTYVTNKLSVATHANDHVVNINGAVSASGNISGSAFYGDGSNLIGAGVVSAVANGADNRVATFSSSDALNGEQNLTFNGTVLDFNDTSISGSGNISGSQFYGTWSGNTILGSQVQKASAGAIGDNSGLTLTTTGVTSQASPAGSARVFIDESGIKFSTISNILANNAAVTSYANAGTVDRVLTSNGNGAINSEQHMTFNETNGLRVTNGLQISGSGDISVGGTLKSDKHISGSTMTIKDYIRHEGDEDTYISFANNSLSFTVANGLQLNLNGNNDTTNIANSDFKVDTGELDFFITASTGRVGIGTTIPNAALEISAAVSPQFKITYNGSNAAQFTVASNGNLTINPNGTTTIDSALLVNGNTTLGDASGDVTTINGTAVTCNNGLNFDSNTLFISSSNNRVGIGTVTPDSKLQVIGAISGSTLNVGGTLNAAGNSVFSGDVEIGGTLSGGSPLNISGAVNFNSSSVNSSGSWSHTGSFNFVSSSVNSSGTWTHTGSFYQSGSGNTFSIMDNVGIGTTSPNSRLQVIGAISGGQLTGSALQIDDYITHNGDSNSYFGFAGGDLFTVIAGGQQMLTTYGNLSPKRVQIGSSDFRVNTSGLDFAVLESNGFVGIGDTSPSVPLQISSSNSPQFEIVYNGSNKTSFEVNSGGNLIIDPVNSLTLKGDLIIKDNGEPNKTILQLFDNQDDGLIGGYEGGSNLTFLLHGNGTSYFKNNVAFGTTTATETVSISGSFVVSGSDVQARLKNSIFQISSSAVIQSGGQALFEVMSPTKSKIFGVTEGGVIASNIEPAAFNANLYVSGAVVVGAPNGTIANDNLHSGSLTFYLDEGNNKLFFKIKDSAGQVKSGSVNLS
tara:strand:+ start:358 stop:3057 length:2700 start_codon:yes stop_codon:yes gene_type:complete